MASRKPVQDMMMVHLMVDFCCLICVLQHGLEHALALEVRGIDCVQQLSADDRSWTFSVESAVKSFSVDVSYSM